MIEKSKESADNKVTFGTLLTDLLKVFDCILHQLLTGKLSAYGFDFEALKFIYNYINNRKQRVRINKVSVNEQNGYHKDPFLVLVSLFYSYVTYFILRSILMLLVMLITTPRRVLILILKPYF